MSGVTVKSVVEVRPAPFVAVTVFAPDAEAPELHEYVLEYGPVAVDESLPKTVGKATCATVDSASLVVAETSKEPEFEPLGL